MLQIKRNLLIPIIPLYISFWFALLYLHDIDSWSEELTRVQFKINRKCYYKYFTFLYIIRILSKDCYNHSSCLKYILQKNIESMILTRTGMCYKLVNLFCNVCFALQCYMTTIVFCCQKFGSHAWGTKNFWHARLTVYTRIRQITKPTRKTYRLNRALSPLYMGAVIVGMIGRLCTCTQRLYLWPVVTVSVASYYGRGWVVMKWLLLIYWLLCVRTWSRLVKSMVKSCLW